MKRLLPIFLILSPIILTGCRPAATAALQVTVPAENEETVVIETPNPNAPLITLTGKVISMRPIRKYKGYWIVRIKSENGRIYRVQLNSTYLTSNLFGIGATIIIHGYIPSGNLIIPIEIIEGNRIRYRYRFRHGFHYKRPCPWNIY